MLKHLRRTVKLNRFKARTERSDTQALYGWFDGIGGGVIRALSDYQRYGYEKSLDEMQEGLEALTAIVETLQARHTDKPIPSPSNQAMSVDPTGPYGM